MILKYPKTKDSPIKELPLKDGMPSGYYLLGMAEDGLTIYVCFCNAEKNKVWIEKTTKLNPHKFLCLEQLEFIQDEEEFSKIHKFFIDKGALNG